LGGKPLISWSIDATRGIPEIVDILVSTDSPVIAKIAKEHGAMVPWLRPAELSTDTATSIAVCLHAVHWYEKENGPVDGLILLQPTSPFRTSTSIRKGVALFSENPTKSVVSFSPAESHPMWCYRPEGNVMVPFVQNEDGKVRSQDLPAAYVINGALYIGSLVYLQKNGSFIGDDTIPMIMQDPLETLDIDTEWDWKRAEFEISKKQ
jgi:CMP-N,N'-diacetyllegionaminic acid synthase